MAGSVNKVILLGHLGRDPEIRRSADGKKLANLSVATSESWTDKRSGERQQKTEWHRVVVFAEPLADVLEKYARKGAKLYVEGQLATRKWQGNDGQERYTTEIVVRPFGGALHLLSRSSTDDAPPANDPPGSAGGRGGDDLDDEIPF